MEKPHVLRRRSKELKFALDLKNLGRMTLTNLSLLVMQNDRPEGSHATASDRAQRETMGSRCQIIYEIVFSEIRQPVKNSVQGWAHPDSPYWTTQDASSPQS